MKLIVNADDFGYSPGVNAGIIDAYKNGIVSSTTLMANMYGFDDALELHKKYPGLGIGVHLVLTAGKPLTDLPKEFLDEKGEFLRRPVYLDDDYNTIIRDWLDYDLIYNEWKSQIEKILKAGFKIDHIDSHHHMHTHEQTREITKKLSEEYGLPVRSSYLNDKYFNSPDFIKENFDGVLADENTDQEEMKKIFDHICNYEFVELMVHPAFIDHYLMENSSFNTGRLYEHKNLTSDYIKILVKENNIELATYSDFIKELKWINFFKN